MNAETAQFPEQGAVERIPRRDRRKVKESINSRHQRSRWRTRCVDATHRQLDAFRWRGRDQIGQFLPVEFGKLIAHMAEVEGREGFQRKNGDVLVGVRCKTDVTPTERTVCGFAPAASCKDFMGFLNRSLPPNTHDRLESI